MHPLQLSQCAPESGKMWEHRRVVLGAVMGFRVAAEEEGLGAQPGGPSSWLKSYPSSMNSAMVHPGLCQQLFTEADGFLCRA